MANRILLSQIVIIALSIIAIFEWALAFPFPSPLVKPLLGPNLRWPTAQVEGWVETGNFGDDYLRFFARDPNRNVPPGENTVSPADGVIRNIEFRDGITYFVVNLSFWDVHVVRTPLAGVVKSVEQEGLHFDRKPEGQYREEMIYLRGKEAPVQQIVTIATSQGDIKVRLITSYWASRIKVWVHPGEKLGKDERIGRIILGSTVAVEFPGKLDFVVQPNSRAVGGETIIAGKS